MRRGHLVRSHITCYCENKAALGGEDLEEESSAPFKGWPESLERTMNGENGAMTIPLKNG